ncbi:MerR family transcriptional regulator [Nocardia cyriacigeorgica]|uniref:MerR family transcriptional regulator n=1 Tax=Nocardia cyriacigeorgica TaxID=135487 RepID=UPI000302A84A|nr:MerR family transcriptional regulator [Nocardia cyriacigeorgica]AVH22057.1 MerR family transcriptional regulator [Nocardia cyriacigeorgica]MBF6321613.1 MerR family transcriptional regulator [Nocardia cyriacigeorgica]MBF6494710.1 MerR family transcriptional regulator [Nocardia cyriacigeorgica]PPJ11605.1 MerR family transcriptional regulator [Nocardia cyriacigeorgica]TLF58048.1 MerR family transcriptional regulator [Nocardia cyriacigeorgica]
MSETARQGGVDSSERERPRYSIGEVAERCGLSRDTLRWYERIGLMDYIGRDHTGKRRFSDRDLDWLELIGRLRTTGMSVADMVRYAELVRAGDATLPQRLEMFRATRADTLAKIAELQRTVAVLDYKIELYEGRSTTVRPIRSIHCEGTTDE